MTSSTCTEFRQDWDEFQTQTLGVEHQKQLATHLSSCPACREFTQTLSGLKQAVDSTQMDPLLKRRLGIAISKSQDTSTPKKTSRRALILVPAAIAASIAIAVLFVRPNPTPDQSISPPSAVTVSSKTAIAEATPIPSIIRNTKDGRRYIEVFTGTALWLDENAQVTTDTLNTSAARFRLNSGRVVAEIGAHKPGFSFVLVAPDGEIEARGTLFSVEVGTHKATHTRVVEGTIEVRPNNNRLSPSVLTAGQEITLDSGSDSVAISSESDLNRDRCLALGNCEPEENETFTSELENEEQRTASRRLKADIPDLASASELAAQAIKEKRFDKAKNLFDQVAAQKPRADNTRELLAKLARAYRRAKLFEPAANSYRRLLSEFPGSEAATNGLVALGQMELKALGQADSALSHFEAYLQRAPGGYLSEAARAGRVRSLNSLGRSADILAASKDYLKAHPEGFFVGEILCYRGDANVRLNNCADATGDYRKVIQLWPASREATRAAKGLGACGETP